MLVRAPLLKNGVEKLHEEINYFISQIGAATGWSKNLFRTNFYNDVVNKNSGLKERLQVFLQEFIKLPSNRKAEIVKEFTTYNMIGDLCNSIDSVSSYWKDPTYPDFRDATKALFVFMYQETLGKVSYKNFSGECLRDHYDAYRAFYVISMCPFCGLEDYKDVSDELTTRDAYDHYLDKARYPFAAVNPDNLFPMCHTCNSDIKGTQDVLHEDETLRRRRAPYPPEDEFQFSLQINDVFSKPSISITLLSTSDSQTVEKFNTWLVVFKIQQRYEMRLKNKHRLWLGNSIGLLTNPTDLPQKLRAARKLCLDGLAITRQREKHIEASFLEYCVKHSSSIISNPSYANFLVKRSRTLISS